MPREPTFWEKLSDALPWNRQRVQERDELDEALLKRADEDLPQAASAAEAMAAMKQARTGSQPDPQDLGSDSDLPSEEAPGRLHQKWKQTGSGRTGNEALRDFGRKKGV